MASPYIGEIRCLGFNFAPVGWAFCNGQLLEIANNTALFAIIGTTYGGDGVTTFGLPNLQGQIPMHWGNGPGGFNTVIGEVQGVQNVTLTTQQIPAHTHTLTAQEVASGGVVERTPKPNPNAWIATSNPDGVYNASPTLNAPFAQNTIGPAGGSQPHFNMQPYLVLNFCIALEGIFPSQN
jgi:microcystin-dependent protein